MTVPAGELRPPIPAASEGKRSSLLHRSDPLYWQALVWVSEHATQSRATAGILIGLLAGTALAVLLLF